MKYEDLKCEFCDGLGYKEKFVEPYGDSPIVCSFCDGTGIDKDQLKKLLQPEVSPTEPANSFCENPDKKCTMNYCDENGCMDRKRVLIEPSEPILEESESAQEKPLTKEEKDELVLLRLYQADKNRWLSMDEFNRIAELSRRSMIESPAEPAPSKPCSCPDDQCLLGDHPTCRHKPNATTETKPDFVIQNCKNNTSIFDTRDYVFLKDYVALQKEVERLNEKRENLIKIAETMENNFYNLTKVYHSQKQEIERLKEENTSHKKQYSTLNEIYDLLHKQYHDFIKEYHKDIASKDAELKEMREVLKVAGIIIRDGLGGLPICNEIDSLLTPKK